MSVQAVQPELVLGGDPISPVQSSLWIDAWRRLARNRLALIGGAVVLFYGLLALLAPVIAPYKFWPQTSDILQAPSLHHLFGTDDSGRDVFTRVIYGAQVSMSVGLVAQVIVLVVGVTLGALAGFYGKWVDQLIMRLTDVMFGLPDLLLVLLFVSLFGRSITNIFIGIGLTNWMIMARLVRGQLLSLREKEFVEAARSVGARDLQLIFKHLVPNTLGPVIVLLTFGIPQAIIIEAFLSFLGLGTPPPFPSWGAMVSESRPFLGSLPYLVIFPALAISSLVLAFNFLGDGLRDALDPRMKR